MSYLHLKEAWDAFKMVYIRIMGNWYIKKLKIKEFADCESFLSRLAFLF